MAGACLLGEAVCFAQQQANPAPTVSKPGRFRKVVPGVEVTIPPAKQEEDTVSTHDIVEILQGVPNLDWKPTSAPSTQTLREMATSTNFRRRVWYLEFTFKPVRMLWVDVPEQSGKMQRKLVWYMIYHVKNLGGHLSPEKAPDGTFIIQPVDQEVRFFPQFVLEAPEYKKAYLDRLIPVAVQAIQQKEDPNRKLLTSVEISQKPVPLSSDKVDNSVWGVATWEDIDPRVDFFSVYIQGLTNAYQWVDPPGGFKKDEPIGTGRILLQKTLKLDFWRPGDEYLEHERQIYYGIPDKVDSSWVYR